MSADRRKEKPALARPLAPRLAATATTSTRSSPTPRLAPQLAAPLTSPNTPPLRNNTAFTAASSQVSPANITPRSGLRKLRSESAQDTSTSPNLKGDGGNSQRSRPVFSGSLRSQTASLVTPSISEISESDLNRLAPIASNGTKPRPFSPTGSHVSTPGARHRMPSPEHTVQSPSFFYANDRPTEAPPARPAPAAKATFLYANGIAEAPERSSSEPNFGAPKAIGLPLGMPSTPHVAGPTSKPLSEAASPSPTTQPLAASFFRSPSPTKDSFHLTYRKGVSQVLRPPITGTSVDLPDSRSAQDVYRGPRKSSIDGMSEGATHSRGASQSSISSNHQTVPPRPDSTTTRGVDGLKRPTMSPILMPLSSSSLLGSKQNVFGPPDSPVRAGETSQRPLSASQADLSQSIADPAADARRERKVLDLEITNSSLLAINRSLEREVRKQKSELRRMRRMTRNSNRQSWLSQSSGGAQLSALDEDSEDSEEDERSDDADGDEGSDGGSLDDEALSPEALAQNDARHQRGDERRLLLDLTKHKELLIDSQKLNQSIKHCLGVTEQLIADGRRALEYQVRVSEVQLGGRVLSPEEVAERAVAEGMTDDSYFPDVTDDLYDGRSSSMMDTTEGESGIGLDSPEVSQAMVSHAPPAGLYQEVMAEIGRG